jgi:uncharacterized membrane protein required for colicin V production
MIMIGAAAQNLALDNLPVNWFDGAVVAMLIIGFFRGRKNGMSKELLPLLKWLSVVLASGLCYEFPAQFLMDNAHLGKSSSCVWGYLLLAFAFFLVFLALKRVFVYKLSGNNFFGGAEYYLGVFAGMIRYLCILLFVLALLNAPYYSTAEIAAHDAYVKRWYGGGMYSGSYFPTLQNVQEQVFRKSFTGPYIKDYLGSLLVETTAASGRPDQKPPVINIQK